MLGALQNLQIAECHMWFFFIMLHASGVCTGAGLQEAAALAEPDKPPDQEAKRPHEEQVGYDHMCSSVPQYMDCCRLDVTASCHFSSTW